jgi:3,4-dihydroxy 2-butanone 4-phosphate synthase/GTP cyclohydrolase II
VPIEVTPQEHNLRYLRVKRDKLGHVLHHQDLRLDDAAPPVAPERSPHSTT